jgi:hypothetical protein
MVDIVGWSVEVSASASCMGFHLGGGFSMSETQQEMASFFNEHVETSTISVSI